MAQVSIEQVKELREQTGISVSECKKALEEAGGDVDKAKESLRKLGSEVAAKKADREAGEGVIETYLHGDGKLGVLLDLRSETDFVAKSEGFVRLAHELAMQVASMAPQTVEELLDQAYIKDGSKTVRELVQEQIAKLGENIVVKRFERFSI